MVEAKRRTKDKEWKQYATTTLADLEGFRPSPPPKLNRYGGRTDRSHKATGFFRAAKAGGRWIMVDPEGGEWYQVGCNSVGPSSTKRGAEALNKRFGSREAWARQTAAQLREHGFNMLGNWSDTDLFCAARPFPYAKSSRFIATFGSKVGVARMGTGHFDFDGGVLPVFHPDFPEFCRRYARENLAGSRDDPWLVGHFSDNELPFRDDSLKRYLKLPEGNPNRRAAEAWLRGKGVDPKSKTLAKGLQEEYLGVVADTYFKHVSDAIREADPNHLYFGSRFHGGDVRRKVLWEVAGKYVDVIAVNWYGVWTPDPARMDEWAQGSGRPFVVTEWYAKGMDSGMSNITGAGWTVKTQADRGKFYQNYTLALLQHPACVGWHWFKYMDNDPTSTTADPSNRDSNKGFVNYLYEPYPDLLRYMKEVNTQVYPLRDRARAGR